MSRVRGGQVFVEIGADPRKLFKSLQDLNKHIGKIGSQLSGLGTRMTAFGAALTAPIGVAARQFASFDDVLRNVRASTGATATQLEQISKASMAVSQSMGIGPTEAAQGFLELLKAGMDLEQVLGGAGQAALAFGKVGGLAVADAAVVMADAMNVFKVSGDVAANTLSAAADASSTSIEGITQAFSQVSAVAALANQSIGDTAASLAVLANAGIKGSDAGTSLKTMLMRLMAPAEDAVGAFDQLGLSVDSFRNADGQMKPMVDIIGTLSDAMQGMDQAARDDVFRRIFGQDAIRAAAVMTAAGVQGFEGMRDSMADALPVGQKFAEMSGGLSGAATALLASLSRLGIAIGDALAPSLQAFIERITNIASGVTRFIQENQALIVSVTKGIATFVAVGAAITGVGVALATVAAAFGLILSPIGAIVGAIALIGVAVDRATGVFGKLSETLSTTLSGMYEAIVDGDLSGAIDILWAGLYASWTRGVADLMSVVGPWVTFFQNTFTFLVANVMGIWDGLVDGIATMWDGLEATIRKSWNYVQSFFKGGKWLAEQNMAVENEMQARERQRELEREDRTGQAMETADARYRQAEVDQQARQQEAATAESAVTSRSRSARGQRVQNEQFRDLLKSVEAATTLDQLRDAYGEFDALSSNGRLTSAQVGTIEDALEVAQERISRGMSSMGGSSPSSQIRAGAGEAQSAAATSASEVVGTFSGAALGQLGFGQSLAQKQLDKLSAIEQNTRDPMAGRVAD